MAAADCVDVTAINDAECFGNVTWAMQTGIYQYPMWYTEYPALSVSATFKDFQRVLAQKVAHGNGTAAGEGWNCPFPCDYHEPACFDILPTSPGQCYYNTLWAKTTGLAQHPEWYTEFEGLTGNSSISDFQYVLHTKLKTGNGTGWQCPMPCVSSVLPAARSAAASTTHTVTTLSSRTATGTLAGNTINTLSVQSAITTTGTTTTIESGSSLPWWCWLLLVLLVGLCIVAAFAYRSFFAPKKPKKRRKMEVAPESDLESTTPLQPSASSTDRSAPVHAQNLFDQIDTNHDGVISREEYARLNLFDQIDTNHDGVITSEEYARLHVQPRPVQLTSVPIARPFQPAGPAMARTVVPVYPVAVAPVRQSLFDRLDTNHDGVLTRDELARLQ